MKKLEHYITNHVLSILSHDVSYVGIDVYIYIARNYIMTHSIHKNSRHTVNISIQSC